MIDQPTSDLILTHAASPIPFSEFRREFLALYALNPKATREKYSQVLGLVEGLGVRSTDQLTPELVARFIAARPAGESPFTTRGLLISLRTICNYAEGRRYVVISAFRLRKLHRWIRCPTSPPGKRHQTAAEIRRILDEMKGDVDRLKGWQQWRARRIHALTATIAYTGLRAREGQCLWAIDVHLEGRYIDLVPRGPRLPDPSADDPRFKTEASAQPIAMPAALVPILADWLTHRHDHPRDFPMPPLDRIPWVFPGSRRICAWTEGVAGSKPIDRLQYYAKKAGVEGVNFQSLRRSWATIAEASGIPQALITRQCRHSSIETTKRWYQRRELEALKDAIGGFDFR